MHPKQHLAIEEKNLTAELDRTTVSDDRIGQLSLRGPQDEEVSHYISKT